MLDNRPRVLIADDHQLLREGLRRSLVSKGLDVIGEASDGSQAIEMTRKHQPDAVLMDVSMPILDGLSATHRLKKEMPNVQVVMLTMHADKEVQLRARQAGASAYLLKDCLASDIASIVRTVLADVETFVGPHQVPSVTGSLAGVRQGNSEELEHPLTKRELEVLQYIALGHSTAQTAADLYVSQKTIKNHLASIYHKLDAHDRTQAVLRAARMGLVQIAE